MTTWRIINADALTGMREMSDGIVNCVVTSPPYFSLRDYGLKGITWGDGWVGCLGLEPEPEQYLAHLVEIFRGVRRVLRDDGVCWINLGDTYRNKQRLMMPARLALALQADGWWLRSEVVWCKRNPMPSSVRDRPTDAHEMLYLLSKRASYFYDADAVREEQAPETRTRYGYAFRDRYADGAVDAKGYRGAVGGKAGIAFNPAGRNKRSWWCLSGQPYKGAHFATYPEALVKPCILAGTPPGGLVLDPFAGSGTTGAVALRNGASFVGIEPNAEYAALCRERITKAAPSLFSREAPA